ncbi:MAG: hypothetical protein ACRDP5_28400 [Streptosporangiaceae bacterium]
MPNVVFSLDDTGRPLAARAAKHASLDNPQGVARPPRELREAGASDAVTAQLGHDPAAHASLDDPRGVARLPQELREAGASDAVRPDEASTYLFGREPDGTPSQSWNWQEPARQN